VPKRRWGLTLHGYRSIGLTAELLPPLPPLFKRRHRRLARRGVAMRRLAFERIEASGPQPRRTNRRRVHFEDATDRDTVLVEHIVSHLTICRTDAKPTRA